MPAQFIILSIIRFFIPILKYNNNFFWCHCPYHGGAERRLRSGYHWGDMMVGVEPGAAGGGDDGKEGVTGRGGLIGIGGDDDAPELIKMVEMS